MDGVDPMLALIARNHDLLRLARETRERALEAIEAAERAMEAAEAAMEAAELAREMAERATLIRCIARCCAPPRRAVGKRFNRYVRS